MHLLLNIYYKKLKNLIYRKRNKLLEHGQDHRQLFLLLFIMVVNIYQYILQNKWLVINLVNFHQRVLFVVI
uniref:Ribosomal protein S19 n=1 Tax=Avrainvillea sp. HV04061 TaxID=2364086 RepID=A0A3B8DHP5_9CHLO|nr:ribosomal protein S19 [Avrainvillea sp. HV04061]